MLRFWEGVVAGCRLWLHLWCLWLRDSKRAALSLLLLPLRLALLLSLSPLVQYLWVLAAERGGSMPLHQELQRQQQASVAAAAAATHPRKSSNAENSSTLMLPLLAHYYVSGLWPGLAGHNCHPST